MKTLIRNATVILPDAIERINVLIDGQQPLMKSSTQRVCI
jgi:hypothetical protein